MAKIKLGLVTAWGECGMGYLAKNWVHTFDKYSDKIDYVADKSIRYYGCTGCHDIPGYEDSKPIGVEIKGSKNSL